MTYKIQICKINAYKLVNDLEYQSEIKEMYFNRVGIKLEINMWFNRCWVRQENDFRDMDIIQCENDLGAEFMDAFNSISEEDIKDTDSWFYNDEIHLYHLENHGAILHAGQP